MIVTVSLRKMIVASALLSLLLVISVSPQANGAVTKSEWEGTGLDFGFLEERVNTHSCSQTTERFLACVAAVQSLLHGSPIAETEMPCAIVSVNWLYSRQQRQNRQGMPTYLSRSAPSDNASLSGSGTAAQRECLRRISPECWHGRARN